MVGKQVNPSSKQHSAPRLANAAAVLDATAFDEHGLVAAIAVDADDGTVLMMAWMNAETLAETLSTRQMVYWSRSRNQRWRKGETSGHTQLVVSAAIDCDGDALLFQVRQTGAACHTGERSCFYRELRL